MSNKEIKLGFRVTDQDFMRIVSLAKKSNLSMSEFLRRASTNKKINVVEGLGEFSKELRAVGRNLNQLTRLCHQGRLECLDLSGIKQNIAAITEKINEL